MKRFLLVLIAVLVFAGVAGVGWYAFVRQTEPPVEWSPEIQAASDANNRFALDLYGKLAADEQNKGKNLVFSPYSVHTLLALTATGANGNTHDQMTRVLCLSDDAKLLAAGDMGRFYDHPRRDYELGVANAIWGRKGHPWRPEFLDIQKNRFGSGLREADFVGNPDGERQRINQWVEKQTRNRITNLLHPGQVTPATLTVLVNAIYFKGAWVTEFDPRKTRSERFDCDDNTRVDVPMMHAKPKCGYTSADGVTMVELPYKGGEVSMVVILPRRSDDLATLERQLTSETLAKWFVQLKDHTRLPVSLPKFRIEERYELVPHLAALGMTDAFGPADFTRMADGSHEPLAHVTHQAFVEVNEEGTEAAAATATMQVRSADTEAFYANRPFLFLVRDTKRGTILFMGRVMKP